MRSKRISPVSLSSSYFFLLPLGISTTAMNSSGVMRLGEISCQIFAISFISFFIGTDFSERSAAFPG